MTTGKADLDIGNFQVLRSQCMLRWRVPNKGYRVRFGNVQGEIRFKLDRFFRGPYCIYTVIATCAHINPNNKLDDDMIMVSPQHLSHC